MYSQKNLVLCSHSIVVRFLFGLFFLINTPGILYAQNTDSVSTASAPTDSLSTVSAPTTPDSLSTSTTPQTKIDSVKVPAVAKLDTSLLRDQKNAKLWALFDTTDLSIMEGEVFSKNLKVISNTNVEMFFKVDVSYPTEWKAMINKSRIYSLVPGDSIFIPIRIVPLGKVKGNTKYIINAFLFDTLGAPITMNYIYASKPKISHWDLTVGPRDKIYFLNNESTSNFYINIANTGNEVQEIDMDILNLRKDILLFDSSGKQLKRPRYTFVLDQFRDTIVHFKVKLSGYTRHMRRIDSDGYLPNVINEPKVYSFFVRTTDSRLLGSGTLQKSRKLDFVKLPNEIKVNPYSSSSLPVTMDLNVSNLLNSSPITNLFLNGNTILENKASLFYNFQFVGAPGSLREKGGVFNSMGYTIGYAKDKYYFTFGNVGGGGAGVSVGGKGISGGYIINKHHKAGAFLVVGPRFFGDRRYYGTGLTYDYSSRIFRASVAYVYSENKYNNAITMFTNNVGITTSTSLFRGHSIGAGIILANNRIGTTARQGYTINGSYSGSFFKSRLTSSLSLSLTTPYFNYYDRGNRKGLGFNANFRFSEKWRMQLSSQYQDVIVIPIIGSALNSRKVFYTNSLSFSRSLNMNSSFGLGSYYNIFHDFDLNLIGHSRGLSFNYNYSRPYDNLLFGATYMLGYNRFVNIPGSPEELLMNFFSVVRYRVWSANFRFSNGSVIGGFTSGLPSANYSQQVATSINYQYQFKNPHFILNNAITYSLMPAIDRHTFGYTPEFNIYSKNGWRIRITGGYYRSTSRKNVAGNRSVLVTPDDADEKVKSTSYLLMFGVRKEFGIPIPFSKKHYQTLNFIAFADANGNGKPDNDEARLENVVIKVNGWEVLTDEDGKAIMKNVAQDTYLWQAFSLVDLKGFFPNIPDKFTVESKDTSKLKMKNKPQEVLVPFAKGIKVYGKVNVDREKMSPDALTMLDLSGIKISATNGKSTSTLTDKDGGFMLYLPYGEYIISMDERILGDQFNLLQNDIEVTLDKQIESLFISFYINEKRRKVVRKRFGPDGKPIEDVVDKSKAINDSIAAAAAKANEAPSYLLGPNDVAGGGSDDAKLRAARQAFLAKTRDAGTLEGLVYTIQLGAFQKPVNPTVFSGFKDLISEQIDKNFIRVAVGIMGTWSEAQLELINIQKVGFTEAYVTAYYNGKQINVQEAQKIQQSKTK